MKKITIAILVSVLLIVGSNIVYVNAYEPTMEYHYLIKEQRIKRANFIWKASIQELKANNVLSDSDVKNINLYMNEQMKSRKLEGYAEKYDRLRHVLKVDAVDMMVEKNILTIEQGKLLKEKLNNYDLSNLE